MWKGILCALHDLSLFFQKRPERTFSTRTQVHSLHSWDWEMSSSVFCSFPTNIIICPSLITYTCLVKLPFLLYSLHVFCFFFCSLLLLCVSVPIFLMYFSVVILCLFRSAFVFLLTITSHIVFLPTLQISLLCKTSFTRFQPCGFFFYLLSFWGLHVSVPIPHWWNEQWLLHTVCVHHRWYPAISAVLSLIAS